MVADPFVSQVHEFNAFFQQIFIGLLTQYVKIPAHDDSEGHKNEWDLVLCYNLAFCHYLILFLSEKNFFLLFPYPHLSNNKFEAKDSVCLVFPTASGTMTFHEFPGGSQSVFVDNIILYWQ